MRYIVFDTETPNARNDRMSQIGVCIVENGAVTRSFGSLVNPECGFDAFNISLTGISPAAVRGKPCFAALWEDGLGEMLSGGVLAAHNAPFDMAVLAKCLAHYGIAWRPRAEYIDTVRLARAVFPELPNHRLDTVAGYLGIELNHHDAASDAMACARILIESERRGAALDSFVRGYDLAARRTVAPAR